MALLLLSAISILGLSGKCLVDLYQIIPTYVNCCTRVQQSTVHHVLVFWHMYEFAVFCAHIVNIAVASNMFVSLLLRALVCVSLGKVFMHSKCIRGECNVRAVILVSCCTTPEAPRYSGVSQQSLSHRFQA